MAETLCYVLMPDHLHWLTVLHDGILSDVVRLMKGRSARAIGQPVWQANFTTTPCGKKRTCSKWRGTS